MNHEETENPMPSVASQVAGAIAGAAIVIVGLRVAVGVKRARRNRKMWETATSSDDF
jgi:hypothetical protein